MLAGALFGPMLAGALIPLIGLPTLYLLDAVGLTATLWAVFRLPALPQLADGPGSGFGSGSEAGTGSEATADSAESAPPPRRRTADWAQVADGFRFAAANRLLLLSFAVDLIAMVFGMPRALFPQLAATTFGGSHLALGLLFAAMPAGALLGGLLSGTFTRVQRHGAMTIVAVVGWGLAMFGLGMTGSLALACLFLALGGITDFISMIFRNSILQSAAPDEMRGRMQGVFTAVVAGGPRLGDLRAGATAAVTGVTISWTAGGIACAVVALVAAPLVRPFWNYRSQ
jgi:hypothetical protein